MSHYINMLKNKNLIYTDFLIDGDNSIVKSWEYDPNNRMSAYYILLSALNENANKDQIMKICNEWNIDETDAKKFAEKLNIEIKETNDGYKANWKENNSSTLSKNTVFEAIASLVSRYNILFETKVKEFL